MHKRTNEVDVCFQIEEAERLAIMLTTHVRIRSAFLMGSNLFVIASF